MLSIGNNRFSQATASSLANAAQYVVSVLCQEPVAHSCPTWGPSGPLHLFLQRWCLELRCVRCRALVSALTEFHEVLGAFLQLVRLILDGSSTIQRYQAL